MHIIIVSPRSASQQSGKLTEQSDVPKDGKENRWEHTGPDFEIVATNGSINYCNHRSTQCDWTTSFGIISDLCWCLVWNDCNFRTSTRTLKVCPVGRQVVLSDIVGHIWRCLPLSLHVVVFAISRVEELQPLPLHRLLRPQPPPLPTLQLGLAPGPPAMVETPVHVHLDDSEPLWCLHLPHNRNGTGRPPWVFVVQLQHLHWWFCLTARGPKNPLDQLAGTDAVSPPHLCGALLGHHPPCHLLGAEAGG